MPLSTETVVTKTIDIAPTIHFENVVIDGTEHTLNLIDDNNGGTVKLTTSTQITALKQALIDAGY